MSRLLLVVAAIEAASEGLAKVHDGGEEVLAGEAGPCLSQIQALEDSFFTNQSKDIRGRTHLLSKQAQGPLQLSTARTRLVHSITFRNRN